TRSMRVSSLILASPKQRARNNEPGRLAEDHNAEPMRVQIQVTGQQRDQRSRCKDETVNFQATRHWVVLGTGYWVLLLLPHDFHNHPLVPLSVEFGIKDALPGPQIQLARRDRHNHLVMD